MYDEYERALTGKTSRKGLSPFGWVVVGAGVILLAGAGVVGYVGVRVAHRVKDVAREVTATTAVATARAISHLKGTSRIVAMDPDAGLSFLEGLDPGDPSQALMQKVVGSSLDVSKEIQSASGATRGSDAGSASVRSGNGDVHINLTKGKNGGSLVLDSKDGHVRFDLVKSSNGGTLTIDSDDGHARIDFVRSNEGGQLTVHSEEGTIELTVGSSSSDAPGWVPRPDGMPDATRPVFSLTTPDALLGAVAWEDDASPGELVAAYRDALGGEGYEVREEHSRSTPDAAEASLWARREKDGRTVFLLARQRDGRTREVLGYGEGGASGG